MEGPLKTILIVEDTESIRVSLKLLLEMNGYSVLTAMNGKEALDLLRTIDPPFVIVLDLKMPIMNGWEFLEIKKMNPLIALIPVLVATAEAKSLTSEQVVGTFQKPIDSDALLKAIKHYYLLGKKGP